MLQDTTMALLKRYTYWDAELLLYYKNTDVINVQKSRGADEYPVITSSGFEQLYNSILQ